MDETATFQQLMDDLRGGHEQAAEQIVGQYTDALVAVARRQIGARLARRLDPEDVVQSTYRSLFVRVQRGEYDLGSGSDMWKLLVTMTLNKVRRHSKFHGAGRRNMARETHATASAAAPEAHGHEPTPADAAELVDEVQNLLAALSERDRPIVELRLQGYDSAEIAERTGRAQRSVRRVLQHVRERLARTPDE